MWDLGLHKRRVRTSEVSRKLCNFFIVLAASVGFNETRSSGLYIFDNHHLHEKHFRQR
jgi:hypothetical protein